MLPREEEEARKLVLFYIAYTCIYFPILLALIVWGKGLEIVGLYKFQSFLFMIIVAETAKCFVSRLHFIRRDYNLSKKIETSMVSNACRIIFNRSNIKETVKIFLILSLTSFMFSLIAILYGAEVFEKQEQTIMFGALMSVLTVFPVCLNLGPHAVYPLLLGIKPTDTLEVLMTQNMLFTIGGAWLGAIAIPLDWDRPWQVWPIPCSLGAMLAFVLSHLFMIYRLPKRPIKKRN